MEMILRKPLFIIPVSALCLFLSAAPSFAQGMPGLQDIGSETDCFSCHASQDTVKDIPGGKKISLDLDQGKWKGSKHSSLGCSACHGDKPHPPSEDVSTPGGWKSFMDSLQMGCAGCHPDAAESFGKSAHALSCSPDAPKSCTSCHDPHEPGPSRKTKKELIARCSGCHEQPTKSYFLSVHGQNLALGNEKSATCFDCHDYHGVKAVESVSSKELAEGCSKCHENASAKAVDGWFSHTPITSVQKIMLNLANLFYFIVIPFTIVGMVAHQVMKHRRMVEVRNIEREGKQ
jgi:predicted CXXCH cytochrome family protein